MTAPNTVGEDFVDDIIEDDEEIPEAIADLAPEAPAPTSEAPAKADAASPDEPAAQPRDEAGRFAPKGTEEATPGTTPAAPSEAPPSTEAPTPTGDAFTFNADGRPWTIEGATMTEKGLVVPPHRLEEMKGLLAEGIAHRGSFRKREQEWQTTLAKAKGERTFEVERANKLFDVLMSNLDKSPEEIAEWIDGLRENRPRMLLDAERAALEAERQALTTTYGDVEQERQRQELTPRLEGTLAHYCQQFGQRYGIDPAMIQEKLGGNLAAVFFEADQDYPEAGVRKGEIAANLQLIENEFAFAKRVADQHAAAARAESRNAAALATPTIPPSVSGHAATPPGNRKTVPSFKTKAEADEWIESGKWRESA